LIKNDGILLVYYTKATYPVNIESTRLMKMMEARENLFLAAFVDSCTRLWVGAEDDDSTSVAVTKLKTVVG
jgi:hypothetical protein